MVWDGVRWVPDKNNVVRKRAQELPEIIRQEAADCADHSLAEALYKFAKTSGSSAAITNAMREAGPHLTMNVSEFDQHPLLLNLQNVTLDLERIDGEVPRTYEHSRADYLTQLIPHDWHFTAPRKQWCAFLERILPDPEVRAFVQRALGYSLLGLTREQCVFIAHGLGANGKSVLFNTVSMCMGSDYARHVDPLTFAKRHERNISNDLARLHNARLVIAAENAEGIHLDESLIKTVTGGEAIAARYLFKEHFEYRPQFKVWFMTNHLPVISGTDHAIWRRMYIIPFTTTIPESEQDRDLQEKLLREAEGILYWLVEGAIAYVQHGLKPPLAVRTATENYRTSLDAFRQFLAARVSADPAAICGKTEMYGAYQAWCKQGDMPPLSQRSFSARMSEANFGSRRGTAGKDFWVGASLTTPASDASDVSDASSKNSKGS